MANQVTLTFAGDSSGAESAFGRVGSASRQMDSSVRESSSGFDRMSEAADASENRFQGVASSLTGTTDAASGFAMIAKGDLYGGMVLAGGGLADLAEGFNYTLIPSMRSAVTWLGRTRVGTLATAAAQRVAAVAARVWAVAQRALNIVMAMNPIGLVIAAIALLVGIVVLAYNRSETFRRIVQAAFRGVQIAAGAVANFFTGVLWPRIRSAWNSIMSAGGRALGWFRTIGGAVRSALSTVADIITAPFRAGFNAIKSAWNNTVGRIGFSIPSWVPGIGGKSFHMPTFHAGGVVPGAPGQNVLAVLQAGERVSSAAGGGGGPAGTVRVIVVSGDREAVSYLRRLAGEYGGLA